MSATMKETLTSANEFSKHLFAICILALDQMVVGLLNRALLHAAETTCDISLKVQILSIH